MKMRLDPQTVVFEDAKVALKQQLSHGVDVARPVCIKTLERLTGLSTSSNKPLLDRLEPLLEKVDEQKIKRLARLECLVLRAFASMEFHGLYIDRNAWQNLVEKAKRKMRLAQEETLSLFSSVTSSDLFGQSILNLDSGLEVKDAFQKLLGRQLADTHHNTLEHIDHPAVRAFLRYREASKIVKTYGDSFLSLIDSSSRVHATFEPLGTATGRVACRDPNLQNLPSDDDFHRCVVAPKRKLLVTADYAGCELRILASLSGDHRFLDAFARDEDLHSRVATEMFHVRVDKENNMHLRQRAKAINFGLMYGMGTKALAASLEISQNEAEQLFERYFRTYPVVKQYLENCVDTAIKNGYAQTVLGRKLIFDDETRHSIAKNMPIQGTGAEISKLAMLLIHERLTREFQDAFLVNMIHDELVVECKESDADKVSILVQTEMENAQRQLTPNVKPKADVKISPYWGH